MKYTAFVVAAAAGSAAAASAPAYAQCGGNGFSGATDCVTGYHCAAQNDWYSQCVPGAGSGSPATSKAVTSAKATTTQAAASKAPVTTSQAVVTSAASSAKGKVKVRELHIHNRF